jgi:hypothetical protein
VQKIPFRECDDHGPEIPIADAGETPSTSLSRTAEQGIAGTCEISSQRREVNIATSTCGNVRVMTDQPAPRILPPSFRIVPL